MNELIISLILALLAALGGWVSKSLIPYIKARTTIAQQEDINYWVGVAVSAAEQTITGTQKGRDKFEYVRNFLLLRGVPVDNDELCVLIESAVLKLKSGVL